MMNQEKVLEQLRQYAGALERTSEKERVLFCALWQQVIKKNEEILRRLREGSWPYMVPLWRGSIAEEIPVVSQDSAYKVCGVDGSQIYPDRHEGVACYLVNIGTALFSYGEKSSVRLCNEPRVKIGTPLQEEVNAERTMYEFAKGVEIGREETQAVILLDGTLVFWHTNKDVYDDTQKKLLKAYINSSQALQTQKTLHASYISSPQSSELLHIIRAAAEVGMVDLSSSNKRLIQQHQFCCDADMLFSLLEPWHRTVLFVNQAFMAEHYPRDLIPCFFYLHTGQEVVRVEIPAWIAQQPNMVQHIARIIRDQCEKGNGYPVALSEAHEQAVVKEPDRQLFFYHMRKCLETPGTLNILHSRKLRSKRVCGI